jgi:hypothetical protein
MNGCNDHKGLLLIIGELLYKNQLLREAVASKDEALALIHLHYLKAATSICSCGIGGQQPFVRYMVRLREAEFASSRGCNFGEVGEVISTRNPRDTIGHPPTAPIEVDDCDF